MPGDDTKKKESGIKLANLESDIRRTFPVMAQLRPALLEKQYVVQVRRQGLDGYKIAFIEDEGKVVAVAGFRTLESLISGRFLYIDDFVTDDKERSKGYGGRLFDWLSEYGRNEGCTRLVLDSGTQRHDAHRFYIKKGMVVSAHHFVIELGQRAGTPMAARRRRNQ